MRSVLGLRLPFISRNLTPDDAFNLTYHHPKLRHRIFFVCGNREAMIFIDHKLVLRS